jgi:hypothetical protein
MRRNLGGQGGGFDHPTQDIPRHDLGHDGEAVVIGALGLWSGVAMKLSYAGFGDSNSIGRQVKAVSSRNFISCVSSMAIGSGLPRLQTECCRCHEPRGARLEGDHHVLASIKTFRLMPAR